jgi:23S rRNA (uracil1939-C5)-methyltransferase
MAQIFRPQKRSNQVTAVQQQRVNRLDHQGRGVVRGDQGVSFVAGALPGELIKFRPHGHYQAELIAIHEAAPERVVPACQYYQHCGGCDLQHLAYDQQVQHKQQVMAELLQKFAQLQAQLWLPPLTAAPWHYRRRTRLAVHWDGKQRRLLLGYRSRSSKTIVAVSQCLTLQPQLDQLLQPLQQFLPKLSAIRGLGHIELIAAEQTLLLARFTCAVGESDRKALQHFAEQQQLQLWLQCADQPVQPLLPQQELPSYRSAAAQLSFVPGDFLQVNPTLGEAMVAQVMTWLQPQPGEAILDLYAGSGHFSIPLAQAGAMVTAVEGVPSMVQMLQHNATKAGVSINAECANLEQPWQQFRWHQQALNKVLLDPARAGAASAIHEVVQRRPRRVVYVSCAPDTFARDAAVLKNGGYQLREIAVVDMFPQTHHIETMAWFEREQ